MDPFTWSWLNPDDVRSWLRLNAVAADDDAAEVERVVVQTEIYVQRCRPDAYTGSTIDPVPPGAEVPPVYVPDAEIYSGAVMYAARQLRRRASPGGVESFGDVGVMFVTKYDADIERALRTGGWTLPRGGVSAVGFTATLDAYVGLLRAAGLEAASDVRDLNPPAVRVTMAAVLPPTRLCGTTTARLYLDLVARDSGDRPALDQIETLYERVIAVVPVRRTLVDSGGTFTRTRTAADPTGLPTLRLTAETPITTTTTPAPTPALERT